MPSPTIFSYEIEDAVGVRATADFFISYDAATETVEALLGAAAALGGLVDAVTAGKIKGFHVLVPALPDPAWKATAVANVDAEQTLLENFHIRDSKYLQSIDIPALRDTLIDTGGRPILPGAIAALNAGILLGTGLVGIGIQSKFLENLTSLADYAVTFRRHGRGRRAVSRVIVG
jgi:hypothetical protein